MTTCFLAEAAAGPLALLLPGDAADAVDAALLLAAHEPFVAAIEQALQQPLDPRPMAAASDDPALLWARDEAAGVALGAAWTVYAAMAAMPAWPLHWPVLDFEADVAAFDPPLPPPPASGTGALLLPPAFEAAWRVALHAPAQALQAEAEWRGPGSELLLCAAPEPAAQPRAACRVTLAQPLSRPLPALLGWVASGQPWRPGDAAGLHGAGGPAAAGGATAALAGRIAPALGGAAFWPGR